MSLITELASTKRDVTTIKPQLGNLPKVVTYTVYSNFEVQPKLANLVITTNEIGTAFILSSDNNAFLGTQTLGAGSYDFTGQEICRRKWYFDTTARLNEGTYSNNISIDGDVIQVSLT